ncbi:MAG: sigma-70 family RNA polymerase sigma factor [Armatimonadetes bacterium]|nr:sigma-70 family RNA polymerase sigma factor [Armatimonadota bacterium]
MSSRATEDMVLVERARRGDRSALDELIMAYEAKAYQYAYRLTRNSEEASDVVADAFVRVFNALGNFKGQSSFNTWLYRIITNCYLDIKKKERNRPTLSIETALTTADGEITREIEDPSRDPYEETERNSREARVQDAVAQLPEYQRAMIVMYHSENMSYEEIAAALDLPIGTVKSRLNRARLSIRDLLMKDEELFRLG